MTSEDIKKAMLSFAPVKHNGIEYLRITAYIYRVIRTNGDKYKTIMQCELLDRSGNSVTIAEAEKVELV